MNPSGVGVKVGVVTPSGEIDELAVARKHRNRVSRGKFSAETEELVYRLYRGGILSLRAIAEETGVKKSTIAKWAKTYGWTRELAKVVRRRAQAKAMAATVETGKPASTAQIVAAGVRQASDVILRHKKTTSELHELIKHFRDEVERVTAEPIYEMPEDAPPEERQRYKKYLRTIDLDRRVQMARDLSQALRNVIPLERQAYNLDGDSDEEESYDERLARLYNKKV